MPGEIRAKLTDFGHCVFMYQNRDSSDLEENKKFEAPLGTPEWNALELRSNTSIFDSQTIYLTANEMILTDIYSFGLVYWSILLNGADGFDCIPEVQQAGVGKDFRKKKPTNSEVYGRKLHDVLVLQTCGTIWALARNRQR